MVHLKKVLQYHLIVFPAPLLKIDYFKIEQNDYGNNKIMVKYNNNNILKQVFYSFHIPEIIENTINTKPIINFFK